MRKYICSLDTDSLLHQHIYLLVQHLEKNRTHEERYEKSHNDSHEKLLPSSPISKKLLEGFRSPFEKPDLSHTNNTLVHNTAFLQKTHFIC